MGKHFGNLAKVNKMVYYGISPYEQRAFPSFVGVSLPNLIRRIKGQFFRVVPPLALAFYTIHWSTETYHHNKRKNPKDYENDE